MILFVHFSFPELRRLRLLRRMLRKSKSSERPRRTPSRPSERPRRSACGWRRPSTSSTATPPSCPWCSKPCQRWFYLICQLYLLIKCSSADCRGGVGTAGQNWRDRPAERWQYWDCGNRALGWSASASSARPDGSGHFKGGSKIFSMYIELKIAHSDLLDIVR